MMLEQAKILIVDDEDLFRTMLRAMVEKIGYSNISEASSGSAALIMAKKSKPDIIMLDINMPDMDGIIVAQQMNKISPNSQIVMMTGCSTPSKVIASMHAGVANYLIKPFREQQLRSILEKL